MGKFEILMVVFWAICVNSAHSQNLANGGFEDRPFTGDDVGNWGEIKAKMNVIGWDSLESRTGKYSVSANIKEMYSRTVIRQFGFFKPGKNDVYILKGYIKSQAGFRKNYPELSVRLEVSSTSNNNAESSRAWIYPASSQKSDGGWRMFAAIVPVQIDHSMFSVEISLNQKGTFWLDDLELRPISNEDIFDETKYVSYMDSFYTICQQHALFRDSLQIEVYRSKAKLIARYFFGYEQCRYLVNGFLWTLKKKGDNHSYLLNPEDAEEKSSPALKERVPVPTGSYIGEGIGYIRIPGFIYTDPKLTHQFANTLQGLIRKIDTKNRMRGWVIDLRGNTGGNFMPMAAGLGPLLGNRTYIYNIDASGIPYSRVAYYKGSVAEIDCPTEKRFKKYSVTVTRPYNLKDTTIPLAVLTDERTMSSGESVVISFSGRPNTRIFGQPTKGMTTSHYQTRLPDYSWLWLTSNVVADQYKKRYYKGIIPDEIITVEDDDKIISKAKEWIISAIKSQ